MRGELDWIVMKALEKDRNRRYESANGFAMDIQRYLHDEPVQACPPSAALSLPQVRSAKQDRDRDFGDRGDRAGAGTAGNIVAGHPRDAGRSRGKC